MIDLSQEISRQTQVFPTYPSPLLWTKRETYGFEAEVMMIAVHTGMHVDAPDHFTPDGLSINEVAPDSLMGEAVVVDVSWAAGRELITLPTFMEALGKSGVELREGLIEDGDSGLYLPKHDPYSGVHFLVQTGVATLHSYSGKARRIYHVILIHDLEMAESIRDVLRGYGNLDADGRPVLNMTPAHRV